MILLSITCNILLKGNYIFKITNNKPVLREHKTTGLLLKLIYQI